MQNNIINQLPEMIMGEALKKALAVVPDYDASIKSKGVTERLLSLSALYDVYIPSEMSVEVYSKVYLAMLRSLREKERKLAVRQRYENHKMIRGQEHRGIIGGSDSFTVIGTSGIGKSTAVGRAITVAAGNRIIEMTDAYQKVIPCIICQCPHDCSVKAMLLEILRKTDEAIGTDYCEKAIRARATTDMLIGNVSTVALNHIGILIIDEIQNVVTHRNGNSLVGMLTQLINNSGISICMVGTPEIEVFFEKTDYLARRALGLKFDALPYGKEFQSFCQSIYGYQYVKSAEPFSEGLSLWLYEHSGGVPALVISMLHDVQETAILSGADVVNISALDELYRKQYGFIHKNNGIKRKAVSQKVLKSSAVNHTDNDFTENSFLLSDIVKRIKAEGLDCVAELKKHISISEVAV